jgi:hypothetical protein
MSSPLFQFSLNWSSEMQFGVIHLEIWSTTQPSVTFWTLKFCPCFFVFCTTHDKKFSYIPKASVCVKSV